MRAIFVPSRGFCFCLIVLHRNGVSQRTQDMLAASWNQTVDNRILYIASHAKICGFPAQDLLPRLATGLRRQSIGRREAHGAAR